MANINHGLHVMLSLATGGLWLVSWLALCIGKFMRPWRCEHCGWHKPEFGHQSELAAPAQPPRPKRIRPPRVAPPLISAQTSQSRP